MTEGELVDLLVSLIVAGPDNTTAAKAIIAVLGIDYPSLGSCRTQPKSGLVHNVAS